MSQLFPSAFLLVLITLTACQRDRPDPDRADQEIAPSAQPDGSAPARAPLPPNTTRRAVPRAVAPVMTGPTPPIAEGAIVQYDCDDGSALTVVYAGNTAKVTLPNGGVVQLSRAGNAPDGGELYQAGAESLRRAGNGVEFAQGQTRQRLCIEGVSSA